MAQPTTQLNATEQDTLVKQIGLALLRAAPRDWRRVTAQYRAVGRYHELTGEVLSEDGTVGEWMATHDIATLFGRLRAGMYREGRGTWFNARYQLDHPSSYNLEYDRDEPHWDLQPPPQAYADELRMFPRSEENVPEWLMRRMSGLGPETPGPRFRIARIFDGQGPDGRPVLNRPDLAPDELERLYEYLNKAPVVLSERGLDLDRLASPPSPKVPVAFHTDGTWIWPAAINFYLREYGVAPEADLVTHIQQTGFRVPEVPDQVVQAANAHLTRGNQPPPPPRPPRMPQQDQGQGQPPQGGQPQTQAPQQPLTPPEPPPEPEADAAFEEQPERTQEPPEAEEQRPPQPAETPTMFTPMPNLDDGPPTMIHTPVSGEREPVSHEREEEHDPYDEPYDEPERGERARVLEPEPASHAAEPVRAPEPEPGPAEMPWNVQVSTTPPPSSHSQPSQPQPEANEPVLDALRDRLKDLNVPERAYRIGEPNEHGWSMEKVESGWRVGWYDDDLSNPAVFGDPEDAAAFMLGKLLLDPRGHEATPTQTPVQGPSTGSASLPVAPPPQHDDTVPVNGGPKADRVREEQRTRPSELPPREGELPQRGAGRPEQELAQRGGELPQRGEPTRGEAMPQDTVRTEPPSVESPSRREPPSPPAGEVLPRREPPAADQPPRREPQSPPAGEPLLSRREPPSPAGGEPRMDEPDGAPTMLAAPVPPPAPRREPQQPLPRRGGGERERPQQGGQQQAGGGGGGQWPIQPMAGEPPLTLFRGKEMRELPAGSELDRFGGPNGNLLYAAGTPFEERSLVPEWVGRPYHVYRVQRPIEALAGVAIPWFNQPGGGAAYLLPAAIEDLLADGDLIELEPGEPPID